MSQVTFNNRQSPFLKALKVKVDTFFSENHINTSGNWKLYIKSILQVLSAIALYTILVFFTPIVPISIFLCILFGMNLGLLGFNVMHEGAHNSFSKVQWLNSTAGYFLNVLGGNAYFWKIKHNISHHTFTNIVGLDHDIELGPLMRMHETQKRYWFHKFQHIYCFFLYGLSYLAWVFANDFVKYFTGKISPGTQVKRMNLKENFIFWGTKIGYVGLYIILPIFMVGFIKFIVGFSIVVFICGLFISTVFQLAHAVEEAQYHKTDENPNKVDVEWAIHQVHTTANFGTNSKVLTWMLGGLNFQIEHHLFPRISHVHYPKISQLVRETCEQFNITYIVYPSMLTALNAHLLHIKKLGRE